MSTSISLSKAEKSYIQASLKLHQHRADGRSLIDFRPIAVQTDVAPLANGSARVSIGGKTEVLVATKLYVSDEGGGIECHVTWYASTFSAGLGR
jgi:exosome complex component RRP42